ncbi:MAG: hypothetical protein ABW004_01775 [Aeromicrobium sp.]
MEDPERDPQDEGLRPFPRFPAPGRPEQPMRQKPSAWTGVLVAVILTGVAIVAVVVVIAVVLLEALFSQ